MDYDAQQAAGWLRPSKSGPTNPPTYASVFPPVARFRARHREGKIPPADLVATRILRGIERRYGVEGEAFAGRTLNLDELDPGFSGDETKR